MMDYGSPFFRKGTVKVKNQAGLAAPPHAVMEIISTTSRDSTGEIIYYATRPGSNFVRVLLVNGPMEIPAAGYGEASFLFSGGAVLYDSGDGTPAIGESWGAKTDQWTLAKNRPGFFITGANNTSATAPYTSAVQYVVNELYGQTDAAINKNASGTVSLYMGTPGSETDASYNVTAYNRFANVAISKKVWLNWSNGAWYLTAAEC